MYLFRQPNSVYYTRVAIPTSLQKNGFPKEIRLSLVTRDRRMAYKRNLDQTKVIFELFELAQTKSLPFLDFKQKLNAEINKLRVSFNKQTGDGDSTCFQNTIWPRVMKAFQGYQLSDSQLIELMASTIKPLYST